MLWYPQATKQQLPNSGEFLGGPPKGLLHTTEGASYPGTSLYHGTQPTFTCDVKKRRWYQHIPINRSAMALENHDGGVQTNRLHVIQIEIVGFTFGSPHGDFPEHEVRNWTKADIDFIAKGMRWIELNAGVPRRASVSFSHPVRMSFSEWNNYSGWCAHVHCPENIHVDGTGMPISALLGSGGVITPDKRTWPTVRRGDTGEAVHHLQACLRGLRYKVVADGVFGPGTEKAVKLYQTRHNLTSDGVVGPATWKAISKSLRARK